MACPCSLTQLGILSMSVPPALTSLAPSMWLTGAPQDIQRHSKSRVYFYRIDENDLQPTAVHAVDICSLAFQHNELDMELERLGNLNFVCLCSVARLHFSPPPAVTGSGGVTKVGISA